MVYCEYKNCTQETVVYAYGGETTDITGEIEFMINGSGFYIRKIPDKSMAYVRSINALYGKYKAEFAKGVFRQKLSYEC